ncbi:MAG TPA: hypothetical protein VKY27_09990 [Bacteriovoracaceae bacterium]|nr:hypothetical protein [Bacteriovoracaceae bacterium]
MVEFPFENYIDLDNNPYLLGRVTVHLVGRDYHCEVDIIHKESHKIFKHVAILYKLSSVEEAVNSGIQRLRKFLIEVEKAHEENNNDEI